MAPPVITITRQYASGGGEGGGDDRGRGWGGAAGRSGRLLPRPRGPPARRGGGAVRSLRWCDLRPRDRQRRLRVADVRHGPVAYRTRSRLGPEHRRDGPYGHGPHRAASLRAAGKPPAGRLPDGAVFPGRLERG